MRQLLVRLLIFGLLGPAATYAGIYLSVRHAERWWWPQPSIYWVEMLPFLLSACADAAARRMSVLGRLFSTGSIVFAASACACAVAYGGFAAWVFGLYTPVIAAACSTIAAGTDVDDSFVPGDGE